MIEVYVAGASRNWQRARAFIERVHAHPLMRITYDWTLSVEAAIEPDCQLGDDERSAFARADVDGIVRADVLVVLAEEEPASRGMWFELGYAARMRDEYRRGPQIIVSGGGRRSIFTAPAHVGFVDFECVYDVGDHDGDAFVALVGYAELDESITRSAIGDLEERTRLRDLLRCPKCGSADVDKYQYVSGCRCNQCEHTWEPTQ